MIETNNLTREKAWELLKQYNESESLRKHALAVEAVMRHFARKFKEITKLSPTAYIKKHRG